MGKFEPRRGGVVYILEGKERLTGLYKIGMTGDLQARLRSLRAECSFDLVHTIPTDDIAGVEMALHARFWRQREWNEWFRLSPEDIEMIRAIDSKEIENTHWNMPDGVSPMVFLDRFAEAESRRAEIQAECEAVASDMFKTIREERGWTQAHLEGLLGVHKGYISKIENGIFPPGRPLLLKLREVLQEQGDDSTA